MKLKLLPSSKGKIQKILVTDTFSSGNKAQTKEKILNRMKGFIIGLTKNRSPDFELWILILHDYNIAKRYLLEEESADTRKVYLNQMAKRKEKLSGFLNFFQELKSELHESAKELNQEHSFDPDHQLKILIPNLDFDELIGQFVDSNIGLQKTPGTIRVFEMGSWIQDQFLVLKSPCGSIGLLESFYINGRKGINQFVNLYLADQICSQTEAFIKPTKFFFEGGNMLAGDHFVLMGRDTLKENWERYQNHHSSFTEIETELKKAFSTSILLFPGLPTSPIPESWNDIDSQHIKLYHLDLFLSLAGLNECGKHLVFLAEIYQANEQTGELELVPNKKHSSLNKKLNCMKKWFQNIHHETPGLSSFQVVRLPCFINEKGHIYSYNNCLIECYQDTKHVFLPDFTENNHSQMVAECQSKAVKKFIEHSFTIDLVQREFVVEASSKASLHCMVKVLQRSPD